MAEKKERSPLWTIVKIVIFVVIALLVYNMGIPLVRNYRIAREQAQVQAEAEAMKNPHPASYTVSIRREDAEARKIEEAVDYPVISRSPEKVTLVYQRLGGNQFWRRPGFSSEIVFNPQTLRGEMTSYDPHGQPPHKTALVRLKPMAEAYQISFLYHHDGSLATGTLVPKY